MSNITSQNAFFAIRHIVNYVAENHPKMYHLYRVHELTSDNMKMILKPYGESNMTLIDHLKLASNPEAFKEATGADLDGDMLTVTIGDESEHTYYDTKINKEKSGPGDIVELNVRNDL
jgi:hypothetical protein